MKQSIVALIRPNLNLSQKESQAAHLIEHILVTPKRLRAIGISDDFYAKNIIFHSGQVNDFFLTEYYIMRQEAADEMVKILSQHQNELHADPNDFNKIKSALIEELNEYRGEFIEMGEQLSKAIFLPGSPTIRNPWNDLESIKNISIDKTEEIFHKYNTSITLLNLSFDNYRIDKLPTIERNSLCKPSGIIELIHPWQPPDSIEITQIVPLKTRVDYLISNLYRLSLTDNQFGLLYNELRHKQGLVYDVSADLDYDNNTLDIYFSSNKKNTNIVTEHIKKTLEQYDGFIKKNLDYLKGRLKMNLELDWGDVSSQYLQIVETVVSGGYVETPASLIKRLDQISGQDLVAFNNVFLKSLNSEAITIKRYHGKSVMDKKKQGKSSS